MLYLPLLLRKTLNCTAYYAVDGAYDVRPSWWQASCCRGMYAAFLHCMRPI